VRTAADIRRENCRYLLDTRFQGVKNRMANAVGVTHMQIARLFHAGESRRNMGDRLARKIEAALNLEAGWLDQDHAKTDTIMQKIAGLDAEGRQAVEKMVDALVRNQRSD
jgi:hypothetical protein